MITFEQVVEENLYIAKEMIHSNTSNLERTDGRSSIEGFEFEFGSSNESTFLIKVEDTYIGLTRYQEEPEEKFVSISLFIIHADYQGFGYGTTAYYELEEIFKRKGFKKISLNDWNENERVKQFWKRNGFSSLEKMISNG